MERQSSSLEFWAKPVFSSGVNTPGNKLLVQFRILNRGEPEIQVKRWGVRTTNLQVVWQAVFELQNLVLKERDAHEAIEEVPDEVAKALMTGAVAFCEDAFGGTTTRPMIIPIIPIGARRAQF